MLSSIRKNIVLSLLSAPLAMSCVYAQSQATPESTPVSARTSAYATNDLFVNQWIHVSAEGTIQGSVVALMGQDSLTLSKVRVSLSQNGSVVAFDDTDIEGEFLIEKLSPGLYSLTAEGAGSLAMFSLVVLDEIAGKHLPNSIDIRMMPTSNRVSEIIRGQSNPKAMPGTTPSEDPLQSNRKLVSSHQVVMDANGVLYGKLGRAAASVDMSSMTVFITKDGAEVTRVKVAADGSFSVPGLTPACYGLVAAGEQGVAALGFCAVNRSVVKANADNKIFVSQSKLPTSLNVEICDAPVMEKPDQNPADKTADSVPATSAAVGMGPIGMAPGMGGAGFGGGGFGGGGGGAGGIGGGLGSLAGIGGLIAVGIIAADNNNNSTTVASPIVP